MPRFKDFVPQGVVPACLLPFTPTLEIDEPAYRNYAIAMRMGKGLTE